MSLAFSTAVLLLVFIPGVILRRSYLSEPFSKTYVRSSFSDEVGFAVFPALILQVLMILAVECFSSYRIDFKTLGVLTVGAHDEHAQTIAFENLQHHLGAIAAYNIILWTASAALGHLARWIVITSELDIRYPLLRFDNEWYYFLTGREWRLRSGVDYDVVWLDALVSTGSMNVLYSSIFQSFQMSSEGSLNSICLSQAEKRIDGNEGAAPIAGQGFIVKYDEILNLNVSFYFANQADAGKRAE